MTQIEWNDMTHEERYYYLQQGDTEIITMMGVRCDSKADVVKACCVKCNGIHMSSWLPNVESALLEAGNNIMELKS